MINLAEKIKLRCKYTKKTRLGKTNRVFLSKNLDVVQNC